VSMDGPGGIDLSGGSYSFAQAVTASAGALRVLNTSADGTLRFEREASVQTATGFVQTGGAGITLPASILVAQGPITLDAPARLPDGDAHIETEGDITIRGLEGPATRLTLAAGHGPVAGSGALFSPGAGRLLIGLDDGHADHRINVANLAVPDAASAELFGLIGNQGGALAASRINSRLANDPYFINGTPWGPVETINRIVAATVPRSVVPSTPGANPLFTGAVTGASLAPNALDAYASPQVLTVQDDDDLLAR
jgi:hypothetical protein